MIHTQDQDFTLLQGDVLDELAGLPDESVHCVVTSPPYFGLRDYGTGSWVGGNPDCDHLAPMLGGSGAQTQGVTDQAAKLRQQFRDVCGKCGARRVDQQLGLEPTPEAYVARMVEVFREVRRVLRADGTCWVNLGDSYAANGPRGNTNGEGASTMGWPGQRQETLNKAAGLHLPAVEHGLKPKDLCGIPWRVAFALQADGWYLRSAITWCKPNCMPESVTDRPTKATEQVFLLTKNARYYYDAEAVRTEHQRDERAITQVMGREGSIQHRNGERWPGTGANARDWWLIATEAFSEAHFATFPEELVRRCVLAGSSERGCCPVCGKPWEREMERQNESTYSRIKREHGITYKDMKAEAEANGITPGNVGGTHAPGQRGATFVSPGNVTLGWRPGCDHDAEPVPCTILDVFLGSGTTAFVARKHGRRSIGIELNPEYADLAARRMQQQSLLV